MEIFDDLYKRRKELSVYWHNKASDLRGAAGALWACMDEERSVEVVEELQFGKGFNMGIATYPVYLMLCGMAMELLFKSIAVAKGKEPNTKTHKLTDLASDTEIQLTENQMGLLSVLSESIIWEGRYPVPKKQEHLEKAHELCREYLFDKKPIGNLEFLCPNGALSWESFNTLWNLGNDLYWQYQS